MTPYVRAWRIEHAQHGHGPFHHPDPGSDPLFDCGAGCGFRNHEWCEHHWPHPHPIAFPEPHQDRLLRGGEGRWLELGHAIRGGRWRYAARSLTAVRQYFGPLASRRMHAAGYVLRCYAVPWDAHMTRRMNLLYDPARAVLLRELDLGAMAVQLEAELAALRAIQVAGDVDPFTQRRAA